MSDEHPESLPEDPEDYDDWLAVQSWWMEHPGLAAIDDEIEEARFPDWALDVVEPYDFQNYPSPVVPLWQLERPIALDAVHRLIESRSARLERLRELGAPRIIIEHEMVLVYRAYAEFYWKALVFLEEKLKAEAKGDGTTD